MILIEENFNNVSVLQEAKGEQKKLYLSGVFMEAGVKNRNGRVYLKEEMQSEIDKFKAAAANGEYMLGELDHPNTLEIKLSNVSHKIIDLRMEGNQVFGKAEVLEKTTAGNILKGLIESGVKVGVSSRGSGKLNESTGDVSGFRLISVDAVATPSCRSAFPETIMESLEAYRRGELVNDLSQAALYDSSAKKHFEKELMRFVNTLQFKRNK